MIQPTAYSARLHAQARDIADRLVATAREVDGPDAAYRLAAGPVADDIAAGASCCVEDQLGLAVMVIAELAGRVAPVAAERGASPPPCQIGCDIGYHLQGCRHIGLQLGIDPERGA